MATDSIALTQLRLRPCGVLPVMLSVVAAPVRLVLLRGLQRRLVFFQLVRKHMSGLDLPLSLNVKP